MTISDDMTLQQIQEQFTDRFPFLKLEFYASEHEQGEGSPAGSKLNPDLTISEAASKEKRGDFIIDPDLQVAELEKMFREQYGLNVQVHRRSGNLWLQTTSTDAWTLATQNSKGENSVKAYREKYGEE